MNASFPLGECLGCVHLMLELNRVVGTALVIVSHDSELAERADRTLHLVDGKLR